MGTYKVDICGVNTAKLPILKESEKEELFKKIKSGDMKARETYIQGNLRLVLSVIRRFSNHSENLDDLFQIGCIGLMKSVDNFDPTIGVKFSTYAVPMNVTCHGVMLKLIFISSPVIVTLFTILLRTDCLSKSDIISHFCDKPSKRAVTLL